MTTVRTTFLVLLFAVGLTVVFWRPLWSGGGLVGGDVYTYYLPQKTFYADRLKAGEFPLWNNRVGHGYPVLGESQTGACYPLYLLAYRVLDVNDSYNVMHLAHYVLAFVFTWLYARRIGLGIWAALFAGLVFVYGWFPERVCWEWAIVTGAYLPLALWCAESYLQSGWWRYLVLLSGALGVQLLAGHYHLAFITQVTLFAYVPLRLWFAPDRLAAGVSSRKAGSAVACGASLFLGFALAAVVLMPSWELKQRSQRAAVGGRAERDDGTGYDPGYGHLPSMYITQIAMPWDWYPLGQTGELDGVLSRLEAGAIDSGTNMVEAHLYFGLVPLALIVGGLFWGIARGRPEVRAKSDGGQDMVPHGPGVLEDAGGGPRRRMLWLWAMLGVAAVVYATGWLLPVTRHLPGFSFFTGPARFGIVATLSAALFAAALLDRLLAATGRLPAVTAIIYTAVFAGTIYDLFLVSRLVTYATLTERPPIAARTDGRISRILQTQPEPPRLFAPGANLATLTGAAATPVYLGLGPAAYFDPELRMPTQIESESEQANGGGTLRTNLRSVPAHGQIDWLRRAGVTHVLSFQPLDESDWPVEMVYEGPDAMLNPAWARSANATLYLYRLRGSRGRVRWQSSNNNASATVTEYAANRVVIHTDSRSAGRLILTDLAYPDWSVRVDGKPAVPLEQERMYRAVDVPAGKHTVVWTYRPASVYWGAAISLASLALLAAVAHIRYWHPRLLPFFDQEPKP